MSDLLFDVILKLVPVMGMVIGSFLIPLIVSKLGAEKLAKIVTWVGYAVKAAEAIYSEKGQGEIKKEYVINFINDLFNKKREVITKEQIEILLEASVTEMNNYKII